MISLAFAAPCLQQLRNDMLDDRLESAAILLCVPMKLESGWRLIVKEMHVAPDNAYLVRTLTDVHLDPRFCLPIEKIARQKNWSLAYVHTHPCASEATFSVIDDQSEKAMSDYLESRFPDRPHISLLLTSRQLAARVVGKDTAVRVTELGADLRIAFDPGHGEPLEERFDRQIRAFGQDGQARLASLCVAIVGLGGTGSQVCQQLAYVGVRRFILVDDDVLESSNLNRVVGALPSDVGSTAKVDIAERMIRALNVDAQVIKLKADVTTPGVARRVIEADMVFSCTDTHASRHVLNQAAYQFLTPVIDMGISINVDMKMHAGLAGHVKMLSPGLACLWCSNNLDPQRVREELMSSEHRNADPYFQGAAAVEQPAVISLNGAVSSVAVTMMLSAVTGIPAEPRYLLYDGNRARMNGVSDKADPRCNFCGPDSTRGWGDTFPLPAKCDV